MHARDLRTAIRTVLQAIAEIITYADDAVELLMMTAAHESRMGTFLEQRGGPALGIFQMEPATLKDLYENYIAYRVRLYDLARSFEVKPLTREQNLMVNLPFMIVTARLHFYRDKEPLPSLHDIDAMARYYKRVWNTDKGAATPEMAKAAYLKYVV